MTKNPRFPVLTFTILLLSLIKAPDEVVAQSFESALIPKLADNLLFVGFGPSGTEDKDTKPGLDLSSEQNALSIAWHSGFIRFMADYYQLDGDSGSVQWVSSRIEAEVTRYRPLSSLKGFGIPLALSSRFSSWKRSGDKPETRLSGTSILIGTGFRWDWVGESVQVTTSAITFYGLGIQELTDYSGTMSATDLQVLVVIPFLAEDFGLVTGLTGTLESWNFRRQPGDFTHRNLSVVAGICW